MQGEYPVITLCGSTRFKDQLMVWIRILRRMDLETGSIWICKEMR